MKRTLITLGLSAALLLGLATTAAGTTITRLQMLNDALYPAGTAWYRLKITGATPAAQ